MDGRRIVVLGGSYLQADFVETAIEAGYAVHVLDMNPNCYVAGDARIQFAPINIKDVEAVARYLAQHPAEAVVAPVSEVGNITAAKLAPRFGFRYNDEASVTLTTNKARMRACLQGCGLPEPRTMVFTTVEEVERRVGYPLVVKPPVNSSSRGISIVRCRSELEQALAYCAPHCEQGESPLVEEYLTGTQYSLQVLSTEGRHRLLMVIRQWLSPEPYSVERIGVVDPDENIRLWAEAEQFAVQVLDALGVRVGVSHIEARYGASGFRVIEVGSRSGGLRARLLKYAEGADYNRLMLQSYLGIPVEEGSIQPPRQFGAMCWMQTEADLALCNTFTERGLVAEKYLNGKPPVRNPRTLMDAVGYFFVGTAERGPVEELVAQCEWISSR